MVFTNKSMYVSKFVVVQLNVSMKDKKTENSKPQPQVMVGGWRGTRNRKKLWYVVGASGLLLVLAVLVYLLFFQKGPYADVEDPRPDAPVEQLMQDETIERLKARYGVSIEDVKAGKLKIVNIKDFDKLVVLGEILTVNQLKKEALLAYREAEKNANDSQKTVSIYDQIAFLALINQDKPELERASRIAIDMVKRDKNISDSARQHAVQRMEDKLKQRLDLLDEEMAQ